MAVHLDIDWHARRDPLLIHSSSRMPPGDREATRDSAAYVPDPIVPVRFGPLSSRCEFNFSARMLTLLFPLRNRALRLIPALLLLSVAAMLPGVGYAHAELESASPPVDGIVTDLPAMMTLVFGEEVKPGTAVVEVTGPDGARVDKADAAVDLTDPDRKTVTVSLTTGGPGEYSVHWENVSNTDGDPVSGDYRFTVAPAPASASPAVAATPDNPTPDAAATVRTGDNNNPLDPEGDYDSRGLMISIGAGLLALATIVGFWIVVRPKNPRFGSRSNRDQG